MKAVDEAKGDFPVTMIEEPKISIKESVRKEKQIVVDDALSMKESSIKLGCYEIPQSFQNPNSKFLNLSLPNSANPSPIFTSTLMNKKPRGACVESPCLASTLKHRYLLQETKLRRSKSCGEGRARPPSDEFDLWLFKPSAVKDNDTHHENLSKTEAIDGNPVTVSDEDFETPADEGFKCCLYLPGFGKTKSVKARKEGSEMEGTISRTVSLEKFECGSCASAALFHEIEEDPMNSYFDLPTELIKCSANDVHAPVTSAFIFDKGLKGVLKNGVSRTSARKSDSSPHHVRFSISSSTSYPASPTSCNATSLRKAREDFNAFLEALSARG